MTSSVTCQRQLLHSDRKHPSDSTNKDPEDDDDYELVAKPPAVPTDNKRDDESTDDNDSETPDSAAGRKPDTPAYTPAQPFTRPSNFGRKDVRAKIDLPLATVSKKGKMASALRKLDTSYNPTVSKPGVKGKKGRRRQSCITYRRNPLCVQCKSCL